MVGKVPRLPVAAAAMVGIAGSKTSILANPMRAVAFTASSSSILTGQCIKHHHVRHCHLVVVVAVLAMGTTTVVIITTRPLSTVRTTLAIRRCRVLLVSARWLAYVAGGHFGGGLILTYLSCSHSCVDGSHR
eukprot:COSAG05_NODE_153_length_15894_cov_27.910415_16_plen_132_part_00